MKVAKIAVILAVGWLGIAASAHGYNGPHAIAGSALLIDDTVLTIATGEDANSGTVLLRSLRHGGTIEIPLTCVHIDWFFVPSITGPWLLGHEVAAAGIGPDGRTHFVVIVDTGHSESAPRDRAAVSQYRGAGPCGGTHASDTVAAGGFVVTA